MSWPDDIRAHFPDWETPGALARWPEVRTRLRVGQAVRGTVIARAPFGVWLDIGVGFPALLLVPEMREAKLRRIPFEDYPPTGAQIEACINALGDRGELGLTQQRPEDDPWRDPSEFAPGREFVGPVVRVMEYGCFVEIKPGVLALLRPGQTTGWPALGDEVQVRVEGVDLAARKIEVARLEEKRTRSP
jgi:small subunit ribosomal protein S1